VELELALLDGDDVIVAAGWAVPVTWNGDPDSLPQRLGPAPVTALPVATR